MGRIPRILATLAAASAAALAFAQAAAASCPGAELEAAGQSEAQIEQSVLCLINEQRTAAGLVAVWPNSQLRSAGLRHSNEMVSEGYFAHTSPEGIDFIQRISDTGYTTARRTRSWIVGENLGWGSGRLGSASTSSSPTQMSMVAARSCPKTKPPCLRGAST